MNVELNLYKALAAYMESRGGLEEGPFGDVVIPCHAGGSVIVPVLLLKEHPDGNATGKS